MKHVFHLGKGQSVSKKLESLFDQVFEIKTFADSLLEKYPQIQQ